MLQEALTNVTRHADTDAVAVSLRLAPDAVRLVADDGRGFEQGPPVGRRPLGTRERARAIGGAVWFQSGPGQGAVVECTFPLAPTDPADVA